MRTLLVAGALVLAACGADNPDVALINGTTPPGSVVSTDPAPVTTVAETDPAAATTTTLPVASAKRFDPPCAQYVADGAPTPFTQEAVLDAFGPLGAEPTLVVTLPRVAGSANGKPQDVPASVERIPGGVLLSVSSGTGDFDGAVLAAIGVDGARRWVRCYDSNISSMLVAPASMSPAPDRALVMFYGGSSNKWVVISLSDGSIVSDVADLVKQQGLGTFGPNAQVKATAPDRVVLGADVAGSGAQDAMVMVDLRTFALTGIPYPPATMRPDNLYASFEFADSGDLVLTARTSANVPAVFAAYRDGQWTNSPAVLLSAYPTRADFASAGTGLIGYDALGRVVWRYDNVNPTNNEGFRSAPSGKVTMVSGCFGLPDPTGGCTPMSLAGVATDTGKILWNNAGIRGVATVGEGFAIVTGKPTVGADGTTTALGPWMLINTNTGKQVDASQEWNDPEAFATGCCADLRSVTHDGGVVTAYNYGRLAIWYPKSVALAPAKVNIP